MKLLSTWGREREILKEEINEPLQNKTKIRGKREMDEEKNKRKRETKERGKELEDERNRKINYKLMIEKFKKD